MPAISLNSKDGGRFKALLGGKPQLVDGQRLTFPVRDEIKARQFLRSLNPAELAKLERYIAKSQLNGTSDSNALVSKLCSQQLVIYQIGGTEQSAVDSDAIEALRSQIKQQLGLIINQERLEAARIEAEQQRRSDLGKAAVYVGKFAQGLGEGAWSLLTWVKEINDVVSMQQRLHRTVSAAWQSYDDDPGQWVKKFSREMAQREHRELVEALGFDPTKISREMLAQAYEVANLIWEDAATQQILLDFTKSYAAAQHSLEWTQMAGGAAFEIILTAVLAAFTGGVGAVASLGSKARWLKPLAKLGELFQDLAKLLKKVKLRKPRRKSKPGGSKIEDYKADGKVPDSSEPPKGDSKAATDKAPAKRDSFTDPDSVAKIDDPARKPTFTDDGKVIPEGGTEADAITVRNKKNLDKDGYLHRKGKKLKYDENGFPEFDSKFDTHIDDSHIGSGKAGDHFKQANENLAKQLRQNPDLADDLNLSPEQVKHILKKPPSADPPGNLTWHHHQDVGRMQLVDRVTHDTFKHTGGMSIWGGGY